MRITGGEFGGRRLQSPKDDRVRPASDKVRLAVFNALMSRMNLEGARVLDGFCGTGSYGLEALSRGAAHTTFIDQSRNSITLTQKNINELGVQDRTTILCCNLIGALPNSEEGAMDLIFLDPPYAQDLLVPALQQLQTGGWMGDGTLCVLEHEPGFTIPGAEVKSYGDTSISFLHK